MVGISCSISCVRSQIAFEKGCHDFDIDQIMTSHYHTADTSECPKQLIDFEYNISIVQLVICTLLLLQLPISHAKKARQKSRRSM